MASQYSKPKSLNVDFEVAIEQNSQKTFNMLDTRHTYNAS